MKRMKRVVVLAGWYSVEDDVQKSEIPYILKTSFISITYSIVKYNIIMFKV